MMSGLVTVGRKALYNPTLDANKGNLVYAYNDYCQAFDPGSLPSNILHRRF